MADSITNLVKQLPGNENAAQAVLTNMNEIKTLLSFTQQIEAEQARGAKIEGSTYAMSLLYQLLCYMILNEMENGKYLWKRLPKDLKQDSQAVAVWGIGQAIWKSEYSQAFELMDGFLASQSCSPILKPFVSKLKIEYRRRCLELVTKSYSSITVKELLGYVSNLKDKSIVGKDSGVGFVTKEIISDYNLNNKWSLDAKSGIVTIENDKEEFDLNANLMNDFTKYVVFMEAQQNI